MILTTPLRQTPRFQTLQALVDLEIGILASKMHVTPLSQIGIARGSQHLADDCLECRVKLLGDL
eukprot:8319581-Lingulodinium_polyedra.AAC.1